MPICVWCSWSTRCSSCSASKPGCVRAARRSHSKCCSRSACPAAAPVCAITAMRWCWHARCAPAPRCGWSASSATRAWAPPARARAMPSYAAALMQRLADVAQACDRESLFEADEVIVSAGGSGIFDLVAARMRLSAAAAGARPAALGLLRHARPRPLPAAAAAGQRTLRLRANGLRPALQLWTCVQSAARARARRSSPRAGATVGFDMGLPQPIGFAPAGARPARGGRCILAHHRAQRPACLPALRCRHRPRLAVGDRVVLGISHPCTTFDKWHWMPIVDAALNVVDAVTIHF